MPMLLHSAQIAAILDRHRSNRACPDRHEKTDSNGAVTSGAAHTSAQGGAVLG